MMAWLPKAIANPQIKKATKNRMAPDLPIEHPGYVSQFRFFCRKIGKTFETNTDESQCLYLRVRTTTNTQGAVSSAWYGKIYGNMQGEFTYFLNPDGTRNVEFDFHRNLFGDNPHERVGLIP